MMEQMQKDGLDYDVYTYTGAITACGKGGQPEKVLGLLDEMVDEYGERATKIVLLRDLACWVRVCLPLLSRERKLLLAIVRASFQHTRSIRTSEPLATSTAAQTPAVRPWYRFVFVPCR